jgi:hypothetical protein
MEILSEVNILRSSLSLGSWNLQRVFRFPNELCNNPISFHFVIFCVSVFPIPILCLLLESGGNVEV